MFIIMNLDCSLTLSCVAILFRTSLSILWNLLGYAAALSETHLV